VNDLLRLGLRKKHEDSNPYLCSASNPLTADHNAVLRLPIYTTRVYNIGVIVVGGNPEMAKTRVFQSGNSQAVRLPKQFHFDVDEVEIFRRGDEVILRKIPDSLAGVFTQLIGLSKDFMAGGRSQPSTQKRRGL
jgi:antitoxin VapB